MSKNQITTNGGYWDIGFTRNQGTYQNTGVIQTTGYTLTHNYPGIPAYAWYESHNGVCVGTTGRYLSYP
jgi:hypothetical protein